MGEKKAAEEGKPVRISGAALYENECKITEEIYREFTRALLGQYNKIYYILGTFSLLFGVRYLLGGVGTSAAMLIGIGLVCFGLPSVSRGGSQKKKYEKQVENNGGKPLERRVVFYGDALEAFSNSGAHTVFGYGDITKVIATKHLYILVIQKRISLLISRDGFRKGTLEEWKAFLGTKGNWKIR